MFSIWDETIDSSSEYYNYTLCGIYSTLRIAKDALIRENDISCFICKIELDEEFFIDDVKDIYSLCENKLINYKQVKSFCKIIGCKTLKTFYENKHTYHIQYGKERISFIHNHEFKDTFLQEDILKIITSKNSDGNYVFPFPTIDGGHIKLFEMIAEYVD